MDIFGNTLCSCLDVCVQLGNCCNDAERVCNIKPPTPTPTEKLSCANKCGKTVFAGGNMCYCTKYICDSKSLSNFCCKDYNEFCPSNLRVESV